MAEEGAKTVSPRGAFVIGLVLGLGLAGLYCFLQTQSLNGELRQLRADKATLTLQLMNARADLARPKSEK